MTQSEALQRMADGAEKKEVALKVKAKQCEDTFYPNFIPSASFMNFQEERQRLTKRLDAAQLCIEALQGELSMLQQVHEKACIALKARTAGEEAAVSQLAQVTVILLPLTPEGPGTRVHIALGTKHTHQLCPYLLIIVSLHIWL